MAAIDFDTTRINAFSAEDFETASIRSAAPSYSKSLTHMFGSVCCHLVRPKPENTPPPLAFLHANIAA